MFSNATFSNAMLTPAVVFVAGCAVTISLVSGCSLAAARGDIFDPVASAAERAETALVLADAALALSSQVADSEIATSADPRHLYQSDVRSYDDNLLELADGSVVELMGELAGFGTPSLDETFLLILGSVGEIWIEDHGTYACRVLTAPKRFIEKLPFRECRLEKLIAGGRVILTEDRGVYEIQLSSQSILLEMEAGTPLWIAADRWVLDLGSVYVEALEVERHW